jgi:hypothetical protein
METVQQSELQGRQHAWWRPLDTMAFCSSSSDMSNSDGFFPQLQWDPLLWYFGLGDDHRAIEDELGLFFPKCTSQCGLFLAFRFSPLSPRHAASPFLPWRRRWFLHVVDVSQAWSRRVRSRRRRRWCPKISWMNCSG